MKKSVLITVIVSLYSVGLHGVMGSECVTPIPGVPEFNDKAEKLLQDIAEIKKMDHDARSCVKGKFAEIISALAVCGDGALDDARQWDPIMCPFDADRCKKGSNCKFCATVSCRACNVTIDDGSELAEADRLYQQVDRYICFITFSLSFGELCGFLSSDAIALCDLSFNRITALFGKKELLQNNSFLANMASNLRPLCCKLSDAIDLVYDHQESLFPLVKDLEADYRSWYEELYAFCLERFGCADLLQLFPYKKDIDNLFECLGMESGWSKANHESWPFFVVFSACGMFGAAFEPKVDPFEYIVVSCDALNCYLDRLAMHIQQVMNGVRQAQKGH